MRVVVATLLACILLAAVAVAAAKRSHVPLRFAPTAHHDTADVLDGPLDLTSVTFGQMGTQLVLTFKSKSAWGAGALSHRKGRELCLTIHYHRAGEARTRICVVKRGGRAALSYAHIDGHGDARHTKVLAAIVSRPDAKTLTAAFTPLAAELPFGRMNWQAESKWTDNGPCAKPIPCVDDVPDTSEVKDTVSLLAEPLCFGAASRDPRHRCRNLALKHAVIPTPDNALITPNAYCKFVQHAALLSVCAFGATPGRAKVTFALVGDSHAEHWRGALEVVAQGRGWRGLSITRSGCPFTMARTVISGQSNRSAACVRWNNQLRRWFARHRRVSTLFVSAHALARFSGVGRAGLPLRVGAPADLDQADLRDPRHAGDGQPADRLRQPCDRQGTRRQGRGALRRSARQGCQARPPGRRGVCGGSRRIRVIDLTHYMCSRLLCFAVVGGALVRKDNTHLTSTFSTTLGPYLLRAVDRFVP